MNIINSLTIKHLKLNKKRTLVTIIGIMLSSCLLFTMGLGASTIRQSNIDQIIRYSGSQHVIFNDVPYSDIEILKKDDNIEKIIVEEIINTYSYNIYNNNYKVLLVSVDIPYDEYITLSSGKFPSKENEIIISFSLAQNEKYEIGGHLDGKEIVGIYKSSTFHHYNYSYGQINYTDYIYIYNSINQKNNVSFYVNYKSFKNIFDNINQTAEALGIEYKMDKDYKIYNNTPINYSLLQAYGVYQESNVGLAVYLTLAFVLTILSIVCIFVIHNSFAISLSERKKHLGILKGVGATPGQLFRSVFYEAAILSLISIPIGFIFSFLLAEGTILTVNGILEYTTTVPLTLTVYPSFMLVSFIFILITIFLSARFSAFKASKITSIELVRMNTDIDIEDTKDNPLIQRLFGIEGDLAYKNIKRNKNKYTITIISLCISIVLFITFSTYLNYFLLHSEYNANNDYDISIDIKESDYQFQIIDEILNIKEIDESVQYQTMFLYFKSLDKEYVTDEFYDKASNHSFDFVIVYGLDNESYNKYKKKVKLSDDSKMILYNHTTYAIIETDKEPEYFYFNVFKREDIQLEICNVTRATLKNEKTECYLTLDNFYFTNTHFLKNSKGRGQAIIMDKNKYDELKKHHIKYDNNEYLSYNDVYLGINAKNFKQFDEEIQKIIDKYPTANIYYLNYKLEGYNDYMAIVALRFVLYSIVIFITVIAVTSVFNTINTSISLREREFSMLRSIGLTQEGLNKMLKLESLFLGLKTLLYGIPISLHIILIIFIIDYIGNKKITMLFPTKYFIICFIVILLIIYITMRYSVKKIKNKNIVDSIKNENI